MSGKLWNALVTAMKSWHQGKLFIEHSVSFSHDALHIFAGVLLWIAFALMLRRPLTSWRPWLWLLAIILWNEAVDLWIEQWPRPGAAIWRRSERRPVDDGSANHLDGGRARETGLVSRSGSWKAPLA